MPYLYYIFILNMALQEFCRQNCSIKEVLFNAWQRGVSFYLLYTIILFKSELAILKIIYNIKHKLNLKVTDRMILPLA